LPNALDALAEVDTFTEDIPSEVVVISAKAKARVLPVPLRNPTWIEKLIELPLVRA
jgi:hypothetical protein